MSIRESKVVWLNAPGEVVFRSEVLQAPMGNEVLCETIVTAISPGTEIAAFTGLPPLRPGVSYPRLLGYCNVARVVEVGKAVQKIVPGDRVLTFTSHRSAFVIPEENILYKLPEHACEDHIVCSYLFHLGYNAVLRGNVRPGSTILVVGLGVLGLTTVAMASIAGARVLAVSDHATPSSIALKMGANAVFARKDIELLEGGLGGNLADLVVVTTNKWSDWLIALRNAGQLGMIGVLGFPGRGETPPPFNPLDSEYFYMKQLRIEALGLSPEHLDSRGFCRFNERTNIEYIASEIMRGRLTPSSLISDYYEASNVNQAYLDLIKRPSSPLTYLLRWKNI